MNRGQHCEFNETLYFSFVMNSTKPTLHGDLAMMLSPLPNVIKFQSVSELTLAL